MSASDRHSLENQLELFQELDHGLCQGFSDRWSLAVAHDTASGVFRKKRNLGLTFVFCESIFEGPDDKSKEASGAYHLQAQAT